jgi:hypothetical protein
MLKWDQGVASRGRYAGQPAPIPPKLPSRNTNYDILTQEQPKLTRGASQDIRALPGTEISLPRTSSNNRDSSSDDKCEEPSGIDGYYGTGISFSWSQTHNTCQDPQVRLLIHHYDHHVVTTFVWIDTPDDRWRNDVLPLAQASLSLFFAILALASTHLSSKLPSNQPSTTQLSAQSMRYRERSLQFLAQNLEDEAQKRCDRSSVSSILATIYILCSLEMAPSDSDIWLVHLRASHLMIRRWLSNPSTMGMLVDTTSRYLVTQFSIINVFASTTSFGKIEKLSNIDFAEKDSTIFSDYLEIIHAITVEEPERASLRDLGVAMRRVDLTLVAAKLEDGCGKTRNLTQQLCICTEQLKRDFDQVIAIYHHSGLMDAYQALREPSDASECITKLLKFLLDKLVLIPTSGPLAQDLSWPLFICGTTCRHLEDEQRLLERLIKEEME